MQAMKEFLLIATNQNLVVPIWEILTLLSVVSIALLFRASRIGIFITYVFTLHIAWDFLKHHLGMPGLITFSVISIILILIGFYSVITER